MLPARHTLRSVDDEGRLVEALRAGDEAAFVELLQRYQTRLLRIAQAIVGGRRAVARGA